MKSLSFCRKCVVNNMRPKSLPEYKKKDAINTDLIEFVDGICPACRWAQEKKIINWNNRWNELEKICEKHRKKNGEYDVVVPSSGGKDSRFVSHILKDKLGMTPLTVTWSPNLWTDIGTKNFRSQTEYGSSNLLVTPRQDIHRELTRQAFKRIGHPFQPFNIGQRIMAPKIAIDLGINLIIYGENVAEYSNQVQDNYTAKVSPDQYQGFRLDNNELRLSGLSIRELAERKISKEDLAQYSLTDRHIEKMHHLEYTYMSYFVNWNPLQNYFYAAEQTGFVPKRVRKPGTYCRHSGLDDYIEEIHFYLMLCKYGNGRATWDACQEIRCGHLSRKQGVALVKRYDNEFPYETLDLFLDYFEMSISEFWSTINRFRNDRLWLPIKNDALEPEDFVYLGGPS
jgi:N-acetyl sugar amidotransferase